MRPAVAQYSAAIHLKFVALGVPAKIVVVVENENLCVCPSLLAEAVSRRQATDSAPYHNQIVALTRVGGFAECVWALAIPHAVGDGKASIVISAHASFRWRVVLRRFFRHMLVKHRSSKKAFGVEGVGEEVGTCADRNAIQEIPACYFTRHAQITVILLVAHSASLVIHKRDSIPWPFCCVVRMVAR